MEVSAMELGGNVAGNADTGGGGAGVRHGSGDVGCAVVLNSGGDGWRGARATGGWTAAVTEGEVLNEAGERHFEVEVVMVLRWRGPMWRSMN